MKCKQCNGTDIRRRTNYPHGRKAKSVTATLCNNCGSAAIDKPSTNRYRRR